MGYRKTDEQIPKVCAECGQTFMCNYMGSSQRRYCTDCGKAREKQRQLDRWKDDYKCRKSTTLKREREEEEKKEREEKRKNFSECIKRANELHMSYGEYMTKKERGEIL